MSSSWSSATPHGGLPPQRRPGAVARSVNPWGLAVLTFLLGTAVVLVLGFVLGLLGVLVVGGVALGGTELSDDSLFATAVLVTGIPVVVSVAVQVAFIRTRGGSNYVLAPIAATGAGWLLGAALTPLDLPDSALIVLSAVIQIAVLGWLVGQTARTAARRPAGGPVRR